MKFQTAESVHVFCVGMSCLDNRLFVDRFPPKLRREPVPKRSEALGGPAAIGAVTVARLGGSASFFGLRGDDSPGRQTAVFLEDEGVDLQGFREFPGATSNRCEVFIRPDGERFLFPSWATGMTHETDWLSDFKIDAAQALLIDGHWPEGALCLAEQAHLHGIPVLLDFFLDTPAVWNLARVATHVIADEDMADAHGGASELIKKIQQLGAWGAVTLGERGVMSETGLTPSFPVPVLDSTGAGDVLHGAFILATAQGCDEIEATRFGVAAGALRCKLGRVPYLFEVKELLDTV